MALTDAAKEAIHMKKLLKSLGVNLETIILKNDNIGVEKLS